MLTDGPSGVVRSGRYRLFAIVTAFLVAISGCLALTATAAQADDPVPSGPSVVVTPVSGADPAGQDFVLAGQGFAPTAPGIYVGFGPDPALHPETWSTDAGLYQKVSYLTAGMGPSSGVAADGTFSLTVTGLTASYVDAAEQAWDCAVVSCGFVTMKAHGTPDRTQDTFTPVTFADPAPSPFIDVPEDHIFFADVMWAVSEGITEGFEDGTFRPTLATTRQTAAAFLYRLAGSPPVEPDAPVFSDVSEESVFHDAISWLAAEEITKGYADDTFRPADVVSRQAMVAFLHRYASL